jgi:hypothetical protein
VGAASGLIIRTDVVNFFVYASTARDEHKGHQPAADGKREDHAEDQRDPPMHADRDRIEAIEEPCRAGECQQQEKDEEADQQPGLQS